MKTRTRLLALALLLALLLALIWSLNRLAAEPEQSCEQWAADLGLEDKSITVACSVGPNPTGPMTEAQFQERMNESLGRAWELIDADGGL